MAQELKAETIYFVHESGDQYAEEMYFKQDVDSVLAEKDAEIRKLKEQVALLQAEFTPVQGD